MPYFTPTYSFACLLEGDLYSATIDHNRWTVADNQLGAVGRFISDGIINGWDIQTSTFPQILITKGSGLIDGFYVSTENDFLTTLQPYSTYYIYAKRIAGVVGSIGDPSELLVANIIDIIPPASPQNFSAVSPPENTALTNNHMIIDLSWTANTEQDLSHYVLYRSTDNITFTELTSTTDDNYEDTQLNENTTYFYRIRAVDKSDNESVISSSSVTTPLSLISPPNPKNVQGFISDGSINILWEYPDELSVDDIASYRIDCYLLDTDNSELTLQTFSIDNSVLNTRISDLVNGKKYKIVLYLVDIQNRVSDGIIGIYSPQYLIAPADPMNINIHEDGIEDGPKNVSLHLTWIPFSEPYYSISTVKYRIYFTVEGITGESLPIETNVDQTELIINVIPYTGKNIYIPELSIITARITCVSLDNQESFGSFSRIKTSLYYATQPLRNAEVTYDIRTIKATWTNNPDTKKVKIRVEKLSLDADPYESPAFVSEETIENVYLYIIYAPDLHYRYFIYLTPINENNVEGTTTLLTQDTSSESELDAVPKPSSVAISGYSNAIELTWSEPVNILGDYYNIYRSETEFSIDFNDYSLIDSVKLGTTKFTDYGLKTNTIYTYYVTSVDIFGRESLHLEDNYSNVGLVTISTLASEGQLSSVSNAVVIVNNFDAELSWTIISGDPFNAFEILRSIDNLHTFERIATVDYILNQTNYSYVDAGVIIETNVNYYYIIRKISNDVTFSLTSTNLPPDNSIYLGNIVLYATAFGNIDTTDRIDIANAHEKLSNLTSTLLLAHHHLGTEEKKIEIIDGVQYTYSRADADFVDFNPSLIVTSWTTFDGKTFYTTYDISGGTAYSLKVNGKFPEQFYSVDATNNKIIFAESILTYNSNTGELEGTANLELTVIGIEEVTNTLEDFRFDDLNAQQIGFGKLVNDQLPSLGHEGRINEQLIPTNTLLTRYDNHTFTSPTNSLNESLFGTGTTFFAITDKAAEIDTLQNFDSSAIGSTVLFRKPNYSGTTDQNILAGSTSLVVSEESYSSPNSLKVTFRFRDNEPYRWMRLTTSGWNPTVDLTRKFAVRMMVQTGTFYLGTGIRKSYIPTPVIGANGGTTFSDGTTATIEYVGVTEVREPELPEIIPVPVGKYHVTAQPGVWQTFEFDFMNETVLPLNGNGTLASYNHYAVFDHLNFTIDTEADNPTEEIVVYIDDVIQITDVLAAGTNQGVLKSEDYGTSWELIRYTETPIKKFYKATNNNYIWGISSREVYFSNKVDKWFSVAGLKSIQYVYDITEDDDGNMYAATDRGVYFLDLNSFSTFSEFVQTQPITPYATDAYAILNYSSYIYVSTEAGIFRTNDNGDTWEDTIWINSTIPLWEFINTVNGILAYSNKKIYRKLTTEAQFLEIADLPSQISTINKIGSISYFNDNLYVSTNDGVYKNTTANMFYSGVPTTSFDRILSAIDINGKPRVAYSLNVIGDKLFIGTENILYSIDTSDASSIKKEYFNKELPTFKIDTDEQYVGLTYSSFNGVISFRESIDTQSSVYADNLPRKTFTAENGGWSQSNIQAPIVIFENGIPLWVDFILDTETVTTTATNAQDFITNVEPYLTISNSDVSSSIKNRTLASIDMILNGTEIYDETGAIASTAPLINRRTVSEFIKNYSNYLSHINLSQVPVTAPTIAFTINGQNSDNRTPTTIESWDTIVLEDIPYNVTLAKIITYLDYNNAFLGNYLQSELLGRLKEYNSDTSTDEYKAVQSVINTLNANKVTTTVNMEELLETRYNFTAEDATNITINPYSGIISFVLPTTSTSVSDANKFSFTKYDELTVNLVGATIEDIGTTTHEEIEDALEGVNTGMSTELAASAHGNLIKSGIWLERIHPYAFSVYSVQNIQSKYYNAAYGDWYDQINSTVDYVSISESENTTPSRMAYCTHWFIEDAYFTHKIWVGTDVNIIEYDFDAGSLYFSRTIYPTGEDAEIRSIFVRNGDEIFVIADNRIYTSLNFGVSWQLVESANLPEKLYGLVIVNNMMIVATDEGIFWNDDQYDKEFTRSTLSYSTLLSDTEKSDASVNFVSTILNLVQSNFVFVESGRYFYIAQNGVEFITLGRLHLNDVTVVNKILFYKNMLWVATDKGLYNDGGTILSEKVSFNLLSITGNAYESHEIIISDIVAYTDDDTALESLYAASSDGTIYQFINNKWKAFDTNLSTIHRIEVIDQNNSQYIVAFGHNQIETINVLEFDSAEATIIDVVACD